jgi:hypothetical protein
MPRGGVLKVTVNARNAMGRFSRAEHVLDDIMREEIEDEFADEAENVLREHAPFLVGNLHKGIRARLTEAIGFDVTARAERNDFDYVRVTRFGHRKAVIRPKTATALRFYSRYLGRPVRVKQVKGHKPASDWVEDAHPPILALAHSHSRSIGHQIRARI